LEPVAIAPGSAFVVPRCQRLLWRASLERFAYCSLEPVAIAPGSVFVVRRCQRLLWRASLERFAYRSLEPVATAPGSVFVDPRLIPPTRTLFNSETSWNVIISA
jgi:hypothetical protein